MSNSTFGDRFTDLKHEARALVEDADHNVWLSSDRTIGKLIFENEQVQSWDTLAFARLKSTDVWRIVPANNGIVYFCTTDGLFRYDPHVIKKYDNDYYTLINKVEINRDSVISYLEIDNTDSEESSIPFIFNDIRFNYTSTSFNADEKIQFSYILDGFDDSWSSWVTESIKEYTNLPHGDYAFRVKAKNLYGVESKMATYIFSISPPWYRTYWAYTISFLLFVAFVFIVGRIQRIRLFKRQQARIIIQQKKLEQERQISNKLRKVDKLKDDFLANTSHELRTPLNGIIGISESLYEESQHINEREAKNNLSMVIASGKRLASMVDSILDYSKLKTENLELRKKPVDLQSIVNLVIEMSRPLISRNDLSLINTVPVDLPLLDADENRLQQILYNLIGNAIKFTPKGTISISAIPKNEFVEIEIRDEGVGIPADKLEKIFDSYEQLNPEVDRDYIGTGLGLTITKKLVELHKGSISVESKLKEGSSFKFTIPISMQQSPLWIETPIIQMDETVLTTSIKSIDNAQFNILIVDDEPINRQVLSNHLKHEPYKLEMAASGAEALALLEDKKFDLVLLDVMMPKISGFEVCMKIREKYMLSELPVIFITAKDQIIDLVEGLKFGGNDYITKPFSKQEFLARIKTHL
ncbi:MAG: response regulator, partial [Cyclobacteriaceae bacterium]|nr:response regulator [Cyclobacteriaceae bacterium]